MDNINVNEIKNKVDSFINEMVEIEKLQNLLKEYLEKIVYEKDLIATEYDSYKKMLIDSINNNRVFIEELSCKQADIINNIVANEYSKIIELVNKYVDDIERNVNSQIISLSESQKLHKDFLLNVENKIDELNKKVDRYINSIEQYNVIANKIYEDLTTREIKKNKILFLMMGINVFLCFISILVGILI